MIFFLFVFYFISHSFTVLTRDIKWNTQKEIPYRRAPFIILYVKKVQNVLSRQSDPRMLSNKGQAKYWKVIWPLYSTWTRNSFENVTIVVILLVIKIVSWIKAVNQSSNIVPMHSLGKSHENRDQYVLQVSLVFQASTDEVVFQKILMHRHFNG